MAPGVTRAISLGRTGEQQQVAVRILDDEIPRAPGLCPERLMKHDAGRLKLQEEVLDLVGGREGYRRRQETLALAQRAVDHGRIDATQIEQRAAPLHLGLKRRP